MVKHVCNIFKKRTKFINFVLILLIFTYSGTNGNIININLNNATGSTTTNTNEESPPDTKSISFELLNTAKVVLYKTQNHSHTKNDLQETAKEKEKTKRISSTGNSIVNQSYVYTESRRFNTFFAPLGINDPKFQSLLNDYRDMVHKFDSPKNEESQKLRQLVNPLRDVPHALGPSGYLTPTFIVSTPYHLALSQPSLIKGRVPEWGKKVGRNDMADVIADSNLQSGRVYTTRRTVAPPPGAVVGGAGDVGVPTLRPSGTSSYRPPDEIPEGIPTTSTSTPAPRISRTRKRTTPQRHSFADDCDYIAYYCMKAYDTGLVCGRTLYNQYKTFKNYCLMDFVNCKERYDIWQILHMGECYELKILDDYIHYPYVDDYFLDQYYVIEMDNNG